MSEMDSQSRLKRSRSLNGLNGLREYLRLDNMHKTEVKLEVQMFHLIFFRIVGDLEMKMLLEHLGILLVLHKIGSNLMLGNKAMFKGIDICKTG